MNRKNESYYQIFLKEQLTIDNLQFTILVPVKINL